MSRGAFSKVKGTSQAVYSPRLLRVLQRLDQLVNWERLRRTDIAPGTTRRMRVSQQPAQQLLARLSNPHRHFSAVHITGSKGKGSVAALVAAGIRHCISKDTPVGTYGSPHVERVNERIRFDGQPISDHHLANALENVLNAREQLPVVQNATWFDVLSSTGLLAFQNAKVKWAVVEVGMGGRLDSTNVISAPVSVITNIHLEHANVIGPTLEDIAYEKAGIIAQNASVVCGLHEKDPLSQIIKKEANEKNATITFCPPTNDSTLAQQNMKMARHALKAVAQMEGIDDNPEQLLPEELATNALSNLPARQEMFHVASSDGELVKVLLDGGHIPSSISQVLQETVNEAGKVIVLGVGHEKNVNGICNVIREHSPLHVFATCTGTERIYMPAEDLENCLRQCTLSNVTAVDDANQALNQAIQYAAKTDAVVIVTGSLHLAGRLRPSLVQMSLGDPVSTHNTHVCG